MLVSSASEVNLLLWWLEFGDAKLFIFKIANELQTKYLDFMNLLLKKAGSSTLDLSLDLKRRRALWEKERALGSKSTCLHLNYPQNLS